MNYRFSPEARIDLLAAADREVGAGIAIVDCGVPAANAQSLPHCSSDFLDLQSSM
jgi:hypothetical protein